MIAHPAGGHALGGPTARRPGHLFAAICTPAVRQGGGQPGHVERVHVSGHPRFTSPEVVDRFLAAIEPDESGCWLWSGDHFVDGYARMRVGGGQQIGVHRLAYELLVAPIPAGFHIDHLCRVKGCINPDHLEAVTQRVNTLRGEGPTAVNARKQACVHGHPFTPENIYWGSDGYRRCQTCRRSWRRRKSVLTVAPHGGEVGPVELAAWQRRQLPARLARGGGVS
jgi:HNH endonuclease